MKIYEAIKQLECESNILVDNLGNKFQRISSAHIMQIWNRELLKDGDSTIVSSIKNDEFLEKYLHTEFEIEKQWYQEDIKFPILCKVKEHGWSGYKIVCFNSRSAYWFQTQFGESYTPSYRTEIIPLNDSEIKEFCRGYCKQDINPKNVEYAKKMGYIK